MYITSLTGPDFGSFWSEKRGQFFANSLCPRNVGGTSNEKSYVHEFRGHNIKAVPRKIVGSFLQYCFNSFANSL